MAEANRKHARNWDLYQGHRARLSSLARAAQRTEGLCVLGAGNCDDLELPELVDAFGRVHVVDIDGEALDRGVARLPEGRRRDRIVRRGGVDLAGFVGGAEAWEKAVPPLADLLPLAGPASDAMVSAIGAGGFDVVLSSCLLTQLWVPLKRTLVLTGGEWKRLFALVSLAHLLTMARLTRPGGTAILATEVAPGPPEEPSLALLLTLLREHPDLARLAENPRLVDPWPWALDGRAVSAHAVVFRRPDE